MNSNLFVDMTRIELTIKVEESLNKSVAISTRDISKNAICVQDRV